MAAAIRLVVVALALLIALQAIAVAVLATMGPSHTHRDGPTVIVLDDVRRGPVHSETVKAPAALRHGHSHGDGSALRHHHATGDTSVMLADGEPPQGADVDDAGPGATLAALVALVPETGPWPSQEAADVRASRGGWVPQTHHPAPFERPPRSA